MVAKIRHEFVKEGKRDNINRRTANAIRGDIKLQVEADRERLSHAIFESLWVPWVCRLNGENQVIIFNNWIENMSAEVENSHELDTSSSSIDTPPTPDMFSLQLSSTSTELSS